MTTNQLLDKIQKIKGVGQFKSFEASGDVSLKKVNFIYGENGTGKTTLSQIFRSLKNGNRKYIDIKKDDDGCCIELRKLEGTLIKFNGSEWNETYEDIEIFDSTFVEDNIHSGFRVDNNHKKNMVNLILGEDAIAKNIECEQYVKTREKIKQKLKEHFEKIKYKKEFIDSSMKPEDFFVYKNIFDADLTQLQKKISEQTTLVKNIEKLTLISRIKDLTPITVPSANIENFINVLSTCIDDIDKDTEYKIQQHTSKFPDISTEWINQGYEITKQTSDSLCPFCASNIKSNKLLKLYKEFFNREYVELKVKIKNYNKLPEKIRKIHSDKLELIYENKSLWDNQWEEFINYKFNKFELPDFEIIIEKLNYLIETKQKNLLDKIEDSEINSFVTLFNTLISFYENHKDQTTLLNQKIVDLKKTLLSKNLQKEQKILNNLKTTLYQATLYKSLKWKVGEKLCNCYETLERLIPETRKELQAIADKNCKDHQTNINSLLKKMNAKFSLEMDKLNFQTKQPSHNYYIKIENKKIPIKGHDQDAFASSCLGNCLSEGDKTTLAFAFFVSKLISYGDLSKKIIVFDDPISSLDRHRKSNTISKITEFSTKSMMAFVLSHDAAFIKNAFAKIKKSDRKILECSYTLKDGSNIIECNIDELTKSTYVLNYEKLVNYNGEREIEVAKAIRPYLEGLFRRISPSDFGEKEWLGDFIKKIRETPHHYLSCIYNDLSEINDYSKEFHHETCTDVIATDVDTGELTGYVTRTINLLPDALARDKIGT